MQAADNVELGNRFGVARSGGLPRFFERHGVGALAVFFAAKGAQPASGHTNVGGVDMTVDIEISNVAMQTFADKVCQPAYGQNIARPVERDAIVEIETLVCQNLFRDRPQTGVVRLEAVALGRKSNGAAHLFMILDRPSGVGVSSRYNKTEVFEILG